MWILYSANQCGVNFPRPGFCSACSGLGSLYGGAVGSALHNNVGKTCTWAAGPGYTAAQFSLTITTVAQATDCPAFTPASASVDTLALGALAALGGFTGLPAFDLPPPTVTCTQASGASTVVPSLAFLGLMVAVLA